MTTPSDENEAPDETTEMHRLLVDDLLDESVLTWLVAARQLDSSGTEVDTWAISHGESDGIATLVRELYEDIVQEQARSKIPAEVDAVIHELLSDMLDSHYGLDWALTVRRPATQTSEAVSWDFVHGDHEVIRDLSAKLAETLTTTGPPRD